MSPVDSNDHPAALGAAVEVVPAGPLSGSLAAPTSKSVTNRVLLLAALASGTSVVRDPLRSDDAEAMLNAVRAFGADVEDGGAVLRITGTGGRPNAPSAPVDARLSGTTMRFVTALGALADGPSTVTGAAPLRRRPIGELVTALMRLGADVHAPGGLPPVRLSGGGLRGGTVDLRGSRSSQFASAVLLVAPCAAGDVEVLADPSDYLLLTVEALEAFGAVVDHDVSGRFVVRSGGVLRGTEVRVEHDASAAAHLFGLAAATGGTVTVTNAGETRQPDRGVADVLAQMGAQVERRGDALSVTGPARLRGVAVDLAGMPDQVTTLAALAALAEGTTTITGASVVRGHETDRLAALATELGRLGVRVAERPDGLVIEGGVRTTARLRTYDDHRLAMAFAAIGAAVPGITIEDPGCVAKTYPAFWSDAGRLGLRLRVAP